MQRQQAELQGGVLWTKPFVVLTFGYFLLFLSLQMLLTPFPAYVEARFRPSDAAIGLVTGLFAIAAIVSRFATAALMKTVNRLTLLFVGVAIACASTAAYAYAASMEVVLLLRICFGIGFGMASTVMPTLVAEIIPPKRLGEGIGYFGLSTSLAMSVGPGIGLTVMGERGFPALALSGAAVAAAIAPLLVASGVLRRVRALPAANGSTTNGSTTNGSATNRSTEPSAGERRPFPYRILFPALLNVIVSVTYGGLLGYLVLYGNEQGIGNVGLFYLVNAAAILLVRPISGRLFDRFGHASVLLPGGVLMGIAFLLIASGLSAPTMIVSAFAFGFGFGSVQPALQAWMLQDATASHRGAANGLFYNSIDFGIAAGAMGLGLVASAAGYAALFRSSSALMALFVALYVGGQWMRRFRSGKT